MYKSVCVHRDNGVPFGAFKKNELSSHGNGVPTLDVYYQMKDANMKGYELCDSNWDIVEEALKRWRK